MALFNLFHRKNKILINTIKNGIVPKFSMEEILNNSPMIAFVINLSGEILYKNARAQNLFFTGVDVTMDGIYVKFSQDGLHKFYQKAFEIVQHIKENTTFEMSVLSENNETSWYKIQAVPLKSGGDNIYGATFFARNIDSEKIIQEERESYIATLTHDLKTPAIAQVRALEMLLSGRFGEFNDSQKELLSLTLDSCNYLYGMVRTLLNTCDFNNGKLSLTYSQTDIKDLLKECVREISSLAQNKSVDFKFDFPAKLLIINADAFELKQVILNFLSNIVNFAFQNSTLKISLKECGKTFEIEFCASSPYLSMEELNNLFKKHITHSGKLNKVGLGLGFYRSKKIIEAHGGKVIAKSLEQDVFCLGFILPQKIKSKGISLLPV